MGGARRSGPERSGLAEQGIDALAVTLRERVTPELPDPLEQGARFRTATVPDQEARALLPRVGDQVVESAGLEQTDRLPEVRLSGAEIALGLGEFGESDGVDESGLQIRLELDGTRRLRVDTGQGQVAESHERASKARLDLGDLASLPSPLEQIGRLSERVARARVVALIQERLAERPERARDEVRLPDLPHERERLPRLGHGGLVMTQSS